MSLLFAGPHSSPPPVLSGYTFSQATRQHPGWLWKISSWYIQNLKFKNISFAKRQGKKTHLANILGPHTSNLHCTWMCYLTISTSQRSPCLCRKTLAQLESLYSESPLLCRNESKHRHQNKHRNHPGEWHNSNAGNYSWDRRTSRAKLPNGFIPITLW